MILVSLAAAATAAPQIVPYEHVEIEAEPYIQQEFVPAQVAQVAPQQFAAAPVAAGVWTGTCLNNLGQGVACRAVEEPQVAAPVVAATRQQQFLPQQQFVAQQLAQQQFAPQQFAAPAVQARFNGACIN